MKAKQIRDVLLNILSIAIKVVIAVWLVKFIYGKTLEAYDFGYRVFSEEPVSPAPGRDVSVAITEGKKEKAIAELLYEKGLVRDANLAYVQILASEYREKLQPGVYTLNTSQTLEEMMATMSPEIEEEEDEE